MDFFISKAYAAPGPGTTGTEALDSLLTKIINNVVTPIIYLLFALAVIYFLWGMINFLQNVDNVTEREKGQKHMMWSIIGIFVMLSAKGIINVILNTLGL